MATQVITRITDDLDGSAQAREVTFALDGVGYRIDLAAGNEDALRQVFGPYIAAGVQVIDASPGRAARAQERSSTLPPHLDNPAGRRRVRDWAKGRGRECPLRGRVPTAVVREFLAATGG